MMAFRELSDVEQYDGEPHRRIFTDDSFFDLTIWVDQSNRPIGFQLSYDISRKQRAITLLPKSLHAYNNSIHTGEADSLTFKRTPILQEQVPFPRELCLPKLREISSSLPNDIADFVLPWVEGL